MSNEISNVLMSISHYYANESREIRNHKNKISGTSMERFGNVSQDDIQKIMDKSKNKNATKATLTWMNVISNLWSPIFW